MGMLKNFFGAAKANKLLNYLFLLRYDFAERIYTSYNKFLKLSANFYFKTGKNMFLQNDPLLQKVILSHF